MPFPARFAAPREFLLAALLLAVAPLAHALLQINGARDQLFVFGGLTYGYDSNLFAESEGRGDYSLTAQVGAEFQRRSGVVALTTSAKVDFIRYETFDAEDSTNPNFSLLLEKDSGLTTGSFSLKAYRETQPDSSVNLRVSAWNYPVDLSLKYPLSSKFYAASVTGYLRRTYDEDQSLVDYDDFTQAVDLYYVYTSKLDLLAGYRFRAATTADDGRSTDHWFNVGAKGDLLSKLTGTLRFGYQFRDDENPAETRFDQFNAQGSLDWQATRKVMVGLLLNRDFSTIATGESVDSTSMELTGTYSYAQKADLVATISTGKNDFLEQSAADRHDTFFSTTAGIRYRINSHFQLGASYNYFQNWSTDSFADFDRHGFSLEISSRY